MSEEHETGGIVHLKRLAELQGRTIRHMVEENARLKELLRRHARHAADCELGVGVGFYRPKDGARCTCGIAEALK